jgi:hypothetical protein
MGIRTPNRKLLAFNFLHPETLSCIIILMFTKYKHTHTHNHPYLTTILIYIKRTEMALTLWSSTNNCTKNTKIGALVVI